MNVKLPGWVTFILRAATLSFVCLPRFLGKPGANFFKFSMEVIRLTIAQKTFMLRRGRHLRGTPAQYRPGYGSGAAAPLLRQGRSGLSREEKHPRDGGICYPNVIKDPSFTRLDLLSCRNVMIYLEPELQNLTLPLKNVYLNLW